jgi:hypothetical protein
MRNKKWVRLLAYVTGSVNQELLLQNEYLAAENRIRRAKLPSKMRLPDPERVTLAEIGKRLGRKALREVASVAKPDTILAWYRRLVAEKFNGSRYRLYPGRPKFVGCVAQPTTRNLMTTLSAPAHLIAMIHAPIFSKDCAAKSLSMPAEPPFFPVIF